MSLSAMALFLLLMQNAGPQQSTAPASIEGIAVKAGTNEPLSRVAVKLAPLPSPVTTTIPSPIPGAAMSPNVASTVPTESRAATLLAGARGSNQRTVTTAADGRFLFENLNPGTYQMSAISPGYAPTEYGQRGPNGHGLSITVKAGQKMQNLTLSLTPAGSISGRVLDASGDPASRVLVQAQKLIYQEKGRTLITVQSIPTDDRGSYRLFSLPPGKYYISATPTDDRERTIEVLTAVSNTPTDPSTLAGLLMAVSRRPPVAGTIPGVKIVSSTRENGENIEEAAVPVYYPDALDIGNALPLELRAGEAISGIDMRTKTARVYRIRGTTLDGVTGQPIAVGTVTLLSRNTATLPQPVSVMQSAEGVGGFEIAGVLPGTYFIGINGRSTPSSPTPGKGIASVEVRAANVNDLVITTTTGTPISGRVSTEGAVSMVIPNAGGRNSQSMVTLDPQTPGITALNAIVLPDGTFTFSGVLPADYRVTVASPAGLIPKSILYNGNDIRSDGFRVGDVAGGAMEIVLTNKAGRLEGNVFADAQVRISNATVVLIPAPAFRQQTGLYRTVQSNADGHFAIETISPGSYRLFAWNDVPDRAWFDPAFVRNFESLGKEIIIRENTSEMLDLQLIRQ